MAITGNAVIDFKASMFTLASERINYYDFFAFLNLFMDEDGAIIHKVDVFW